MTLSAYALVTLDQVKSYLKIDAAASLHIDAEYVGAGTGTEDDFTLDNTPIAGTVKIYVDNVLKTETTNYTLTGAAIKFVAASIPVNGKIVTAAYDKAATSGTFNGYEDGNLELLIEAITKLAEDKTGRAFVQRSFTETYMGDGSKILKLNKTPVVSITSVSWKNVERFTGDASTLVFTLGETPISGTFSVYVNGTLKTVTSDYTQSGTALTFVTAPADDAKIICRYNVELDLEDDYTEQLSIGRLKGSWLSGYEYEVVYIAGYAATMELAQAAVPDAKMFVLKASAFLYENRTGFKSQAITGIGSIDYGDIDELPPSIMKWLHGFSRGGLLC